MAGKWFERAYRRTVTDMHITDFDERFMSQYDPQAYVDLLVLADVQAALVYAQSHVGLCYFPTRIGRRHGALKGRDIFGETVDLCHSSGISVIAYYSLIFDTWAYRDHPDWRIIGSDGLAVSESSRYGVCCPNSPYRDYASAIVEEMCANYDFEGLFFDMTFWPRVCYCTHCQKRYTEEVGGELPRIINWEDPRWVAFQRRREEWLFEFASLMTSTVKSVKPGIQVEHQGAAYMTSWRFGTSARLATQSDLMEGDYYGDATQGSFARKLFNNLSKNRPTGFMTCIAVDLGNLTTLKPPELLRAKTYASLADGCAFSFIDQVDPVGTFNRAVYERMREVWAETQAYEKYVGGRPCHDVAIYLSMESKLDMADNGKAVNDSGLSKRMPHLDSALGAAQSLVEAHIPYDVITKNNIEDLYRYQIVVLPGVTMMDEEEMAAFEEYVRAGGCLYASRQTSLITTDGTRRHDFALAEVLGVSHKGETKEHFTYIAPIEGGEDLLAGFTVKHPAGLYSSQMIVEAQAGAEVLGTIVLPYTDPADPARFASIHNNPPGIITDLPAIVLNHYGRGKAVYVAADLESADPHREVFIRLIRMLAKPFSFEADAPKSVEVTLFKQDDHRRWLVSIVNFQKQLPNIPVHDVTVRVRLDGEIPQRLLALPDEERHPHIVKGGYLEFTVPVLEDFAMYALCYA